MKTPFKMNLQQFAFNPDTTTLQDAKTGSVPREYADLVIGDTMSGSAIMQLATFEEMTKQEKEFNYLANGVGAYWVNETDRIQTSKPTWAKAVMHAKKLGVIIPTSKENLQYSVSNFFELMRPEIAKAFAQKFDLAALWGTDSPFPTKDSIWNDIDTSGNKIELNSLGSTYEELNQLLGLIEEEDGDPNGFVTIKANNKLFRGVVDQNGRPLFQDATQGTPANLLGESVGYVKKSVFDRTKAELLTGDWDYARYSVLQDIDYEILTEATLTTIDDGAGNPISLAERDMVALKATMQVAFMRLKDGNFAAITPDVTP